MGLFSRREAGEMAGDDAQGQPPLHPVLPVIATSAPAKVASEAGNAPFNACTPAIAPAPVARVLQCSSFLRELARRWNGHPLDPSGQQAFLRLCRLHAPVARYQTRRMRKERLVVRHRLNGLPMLGWVFQNLVARHDAALHFIQDDMPSELDQRAAFVARDGA